MAFLPPSVVIDVNKHSVNNYDDVRRRNIFSSNISSKNIFVSSSTSSISYHERMVINNDLSNQEHIKSVNNSQLSYSSNGQGSNQNSMATIPVPSQKLQYVSNKASTLNTCNILCVDNNNVINIQLP